MGRNRLAIYLNDHLAGATAGLELCKRAAASNRETPFGDALAELAEQIAGDRDTLVRAMGLLSIGQDRVKVLASWSAEKAGRLKLNGQLRGYSPLSRLEELEFLSLGVEGKIAMWQALRRSHGEDRRLGSIDFDELIERGRSQRRALERLRRRAAVDALA